jgi:hypothetical protein
MIENISVTLPPGASYRVANESDPNNNNAIRELREQVV